MTVHIALFYVRAQIYFSFCTSIPEYLWCFLHGDVKANEQKKQRIKTFNKEAKKFHNRSRFINYEKSEQKLCAVSLKIF